MKIKSRTEETQPCKVDYNSNGNLIGFTYRGNAYFYIKNHMNDVMGIGGKDKLKLERFF